MFGVIVKREQVVGPKGLGMAALALGLFLSGCSSTSLNRAPVEDRGTAPKPTVVVAPEPAPVAAPAKPAPGAENAGKPGYYTVKPKDTLIAIGLETGQSYKDIARWNNLDNPNKIEVGQVLRVAAPGTNEGTAVTKPVSTGTVVATTVAPGEPAKAASSPSAAASAASPASSASAAGGDDDLGWIWPSAGPLMTAFDEGKNKGIDIGGAAGDPVLAAADGRVIWAAAGEGTMRHYGNLIIVQHNKTYLTAYANNSTLLVKEDQRIKKGQKIAEMGKSGTDKVKLHFELRRMGVAVDPGKYLPAR
ncbi:MAG: peptidase [Comamonadaceae bacterium PBBC2]|nr:MAG: peptidase [Comamonadaceae bacterium PBBC2]